MVVVLVPDKLGGGLLNAVILGGLDGFQSTSDRTGGDAISGWYITNFHNLAVDINDGVAELG